MYIKPDELEKEIGEFDFLDLAYYGIHTTSDEILGFFRDAPLLEKADLLDEAAELRFSDDKLSFFAVSVNAYFASVAADFIRRKLLETGVSFTLETVMSFDDKVELLRNAQLRGFRTYLYFIVNGYSHRPWWLLSVGGEAEEQADTQLDIKSPSVPGAVRRRGKRWRIVGMFQRGWSLIVAALLNHQLLPVKPGRPEGWPSLPEMNGQNLTFCTAGEGG